jgi:Lon protease-like protein
VNKDLPSNGLSDKKRSTSCETQRVADVMDLPLFPLNTVLFPGMYLPLHIFETRYQDMIGHCLERRKPFGVVLIEKGAQVGAPAVPEKVGTTARIRRVQHHPDGCMDIQTVGVHRFQIDELDYSKSYLTGSVRQVPVVNGATRSANQLAQKLRPRLVEYMELLKVAHSAEAELAYVPHDPKSLAFMVAASLQLKSADKQKLLELPGIPDMLRQEYRLLNQEILLLKYISGTQEEIAGMSNGSTGYLFPN